MGILGDKALDDLPKGEDRGILTAVFEKILETRTGIGDDSLTLSDLSQLVDMFELEGTVPKLPQDADTKALERLGAPADTGRKRKHRKGN